MSRKAARFTEADVRRALKAAKSQGNGFAVEIDTTGTIRIVPYEKPPTPANDDAGDAVPPVSKVRL